MRTSNSKTDTLSIEQLRSEFNGNVIAPGDAEYDKARTVFYGGVDRRHHSSQECG